MWQQQAEACRDASCDELVRLSSEPEFGTSSAGCLDDVAQPHGETRGDVEQRGGGVVVVQALEEYP